MSWRDRQTPGQRPNTAGIHCAPNAWWHVCVCRLSTFPHCAPNTCCSLCTPYTYCSHCAPNTFTLCTQYIHVVHPIHEAFNMSTLCTQYMLFTLCTQHIHIVHPILSHCAPNKFTLCTQYMLKACTHTCQRVCVCAAFFFHVLFSVCFKKMKPDLTELHAVRALL